MESEPETEGKPESEVERSGIGSNVAGSKIRSSKTGTKTGGIGRGNGSSETRGPSALLN